MLVTRPHLTAADSPELGVASACLTRMDRNAPAAAADSLAERCLR
jgi:hypothetical protein